MALSSIDAIPIILNVFDRNNRIRAKKVRKFSTFVYDKNNYKESLRVRTLREHKN